ncbi:hypothetical protein VTG60DRAFT_795 [Thermothelomyces hinnuleus]
MPIERRQDYHSSTKLRPNRIFCDKEEVCQRIASHWKEHIREEAKQLIVDWPWDRKYFDDNDVVVKVKIRILAGGYDLEGIVPATIARKFLDLPRTKEQRLAASLKRKIDLLSFKLRESTPELPMFSDRLQHPWIDLEPIEQQNSSDDADDEWSEWDDA